MLLVSAAGCGAPGPGPDAAGERNVSAAIRERVDRVLSRHPAEALADVRIGLWVEGRSGRALFARAADTSFPSASAIKTAYMVELFDAFPELDAPLPGADAVLDSPSHPALAHFDRATRREIGGELHGATTRRVARAMIRGDDVSNAVYNAAANVVTAVLGGPDALTRRLHARDRAWQGLQVRRYMLAARDVTGDNEATVSALAAVLRGIADGDVPGLDRRLYAPMRDILSVTAPPPPLVGGRHFFKSGSLDSDPPVRLLSGWWESSDGNRALYVVAVSSPGSPGGRAQAHGAWLQELAEELRAALLEEWTVTAPGPVGSAEPTGSIAGGTLGVGRSLGSGQPP